MGNFNSSRWEGHERRWTVEEAICALRVCDLPPLEPTALAAGTLWWAGPDGAVRAEVIFALATEADQRRTLALLCLAAGAGPCGRTWRSTGRRSPWAAAGGSAARGAATAAGPSTSPPGPPTFGAECARGSP